MFRGEARLALFKWYDRACSSLCFCNFVLVVVKSASLEIASLWPQVISKSGCAGISKSIRTGLCARVPKSVPKVVLEFATSHFHRSITSDLWRTFSAACGLVQPSTVYCFHYSMRAPLQRPLPFPGPKQVDGTHNICSRNFFFIPNPSCEQNLVSYVAPLRNVWPLPTLFHYLTSPFIIFVPV